MRGQAGVTWFARPVICATFNGERPAFYEQLSLDPLPASTDIQTKLCRPELLVEIEAIVMFRTQRQDASADLQ
jgi:enamine deaminase RidA (YjgF/YER057c/UK114 family)